MANGIPTNVSNRRTVITDIIHVETVESVETVETVKSVERNTDNELHNSVATCILVLLYFSYTPLCAMKLHKT